MVRSIVVACLFGTHALHRLRQRNHRQWRTSFRLVAEAHIGRQAGTDGARDHPRQHGARLRVGVDHSVIGGIGPLRFLVAERAVQGVEIPAANQRAGPKGTQDANLLIDAGHLGVQGLQ